MQNQKLTILLIALMCFISVNGFFTVICHGADGHIAVEPAIHKHCQCPETPQTSDQHKFTANLIDSSTDHEHCKDSIANSNILVSPRKNIKLSTHKILTPNLLLNTAAAHSSSVFSLLTRSYELSSFHTPLRTVILLA